MSKINSYRLLNIFFVLSSFLLISCSDNDDAIGQDQLEGYTLVKSYNDSFDTLKEFWDKRETTDDTRYEITKDPINNNNNVLRFHLHPDDWNANGKRNEFKKDYDFTFDADELKSEYSFKFLFSEDFLKSREEIDWIMIHQWHDKPPKGMSWGDYDLGTHPPVNVFIQVKPNNENYIVYNYGLWTKDFNDVQTYIYSEPLEPNKWYEFENVVKWSYNEDGYSIPKINGEFLSDISSEGKVFGANAYNDQGNYYKMGLYGNYAAQDTISVNFDDFNSNLYMKQE